MITKETKIPFGKHKNTKLINIPTSYLNWMADKLINSDFHEYALIAKDIIAERANDTTAKIDETADDFLIRHGYKHLTKKYK